MAERVSPVEVGKKLNLLENYLRKIEEVVNDRARVHEEIKRNYLSLRMKVALKRMEEMPVEKLSIEGCVIRTASLKSAGFSNLRQIAAASKNQIDAVQGIGDETLKRIIQRTKEIYKKTEEEVRVRLEPSMKEANNVVGYCAESLATEVEFERLNRIAGAIDPTTARRKMELADKLTSPVMLMFAKEADKAAAREAYEWISDVITALQAEDIDFLYQNYFTHKQSVTLQTAWDSFNKNTAPFYAVLEKIVGNIMVASNLTYGLTEELVKTIHAYELNLPLLKATLRNYQEFGTKYILFQKRTLLGDEMGLGKTMQAIAAMAHLKQIGMTHFIVVCPVSVLVNWVREIKQHSALEVMSIYGDNRSEQFLEWVENGNVAITTYETVTRLIETGVLSEETQIPNFMITVDEAHYLKNPEAARTQSVRVLSQLAEYALYMTGTPIENNVDEMIFLISQLNEELAGIIRDMKDLSDAPEFREKVSPVYLRRTREEVLSELPEMEEIDEWCVMTAEEKKLYIDLLAEGNFMKLRQMSFLAGQDSSSKIIRLLEIIREAKQEKRKIIVFSYFTNTIQLLKEILQEQAYGPISGAVSPDDRQAIVDEFSEGEDGSVLLCQIVAGGVGLNIQAASVVIIAEPQLKPSIENQAISRAYRMGQARNVIVFHMLSDETIDERIVDILRKKTEIFDSFADYSSAGDESMELLQNESEQKMLAQILEEERKKYDVPEDIK